MWTAMGPTLADIEAARALIAGFARTTPLHSSETIGTFAGRPVLLKAENLQRTGSFKIRGAVAKIAALPDDQRRRGVVAASAGNHGQAVAWAARKAGIPATIFVPEYAPMAKVDAARGYGADVIMTGAGYDEADAESRALAATGATLIHAFEDPEVIAGQGTVGLELAEQLPADTEVVVLPVGGGGLASGVAIALRELRPDLRLVGVQAAACAPLAGGQVGGHTIADGIAVKHPGELTSAILAEKLDGFVTVTDEEIAHAIVLLLERAKLVVEGAGAASLAAILARKVEGYGRAAALLSGGNVDASLLIEIARYSLSRAGRFLVVRTLVPDRPGALAKLLTEIAGEHVNLIAVQHQREGLDTTLGVTAVELTMQTRDEEHCLEVLARLAEWGYQAERLG
jgi:threonine dehydratase